LGQWSPELSVLYVRGNANFRRIAWKKQFHVYVSSYDTFARDVHSENFDSKRLKHFDVVVLDEAHHIKNPDSKRTQAIKKLSPKYRWALTGTPIQNSVEDLISLFDFVYPKYLTTRIPEEIVKVIKPYFLRRRKAEVLNDLPPKQRQEYWLEMNEKQRKVYLETEEGIRDEVMSILLHKSLNEQQLKTHILSKIQKLKQVINFPPESSDSPKIDLLKEQLDEIIQSDSKVVIFSQYIEEGIKKIEKCIQNYKTAQIVGNQKTNERRRQIEAFKNSKDVHILLASIKSGGEGLNLTEASYVIHFDHWWNPATMWQAEDRVHRRGQVRGVNVYSYWVKDTIDERIYSILRQKGLLFEKVIDNLSEAVIEEKMTLEDYLHILGIQSHKIIPTEKKPTNDGFQATQIQEVQRKLLQLSPEELETLSENLLMYLGYPNVSRIGRSGDGGIDLIASQNTNEGIEKIAVQCKRYNGRVGVAIARNLLGAMANDQTINQALLITTGQFTRGCLQFCLANNIRTVDGLELAKYVLKFGLDKFY
jgi:SNF2 family DNA or RNA helicase